MHSKFYDEDARSTTEEMLAVLCALRANSFAVKRPAATLASATVPAPHGGAAGCGGPQPEDFDSDSSGDGDGDGDGDSDGGRGAGRGVVTRLPLHYTPGRPRYNLNPTVYALCPKRLTRKLQTLNP